MKVPAYIRNHESVVSFFERWPSFHDANVLVCEVAADSIRITLHTWLMTGQLDGKGYFVLRNHALVTFHFDGVHTVQMGAFEAGNILFGLEISPCSDSASFHVELDSVIDKSGSFSAQSGEVISVIPCTRDGKAL